MEPLDLATVAVGALTALSTGVAGGQRSGLSPGQTG